MLFGMLVMKVGILFKGMDYVIGVVVDKVFICYINM